jgi:ribulose-bisphosphate carboxylase large chain
MVSYEDFVHLDYKPKYSDLLTSFRIGGLSEGTSFKRGAGAVAAESSIGTWTELTTTKPYMMNLAAKVYDINPIDKSSAFIKIAYPIELFEYGNIPNILSSIAGNVFGMKEVRDLRFIDLELPKDIVNCYDGPKYGLNGVRKITGVKNRPLIGTIVKPKLGLNTKDHAKVAYEAWSGGCDIVKDDENLSSQCFNKFDARLKETLKMKRKAEKETGEKKMYMINITAETVEMLKRAKLVERSGNEYIMVDILTVGWSALQTLRNADFKLVLHAHRAGHAALDKVPYHGIKMKVLARLSRLCGMDQLHVGTVVGKMFETKEEVLENVEVLKDEFHGLKKVMPVASGGLQPGMVPQLIDTFGKDVIIQMGGGIHGHPKGTIAGAKAARAAVNGVSEGLTLQEVARKSKELKEALEHWK